jgi:UDPglucose 6-dehydrogenase
LGTVIALADAHGTDAGVVRAFLANSRHRRAWAARMLRELLGHRLPQSTVAVWGLAYKENTDSVRNSPALATLAALPHVTFVLHDPVVQADAVPRGLAVAAGDPLEILANVDALMILTPWPQYRDADPARIARAMRGRVVIDPYRVLDRGRAIAAGLEYHALGVRAGPDDEV